MSELRANRKSESTDLWIVGIHDEAKFKVVAIAENEAEAEGIADALSSMGKPVWWKAKTFG